MGQSLCSVAKSGKGFPPKLPLLNAVQRSQILNHWWHKSGRQIPQPLEHLCPEWRSCVYAAHLKAAFPLLATIEKTQERKSKVSLEACCTICFENRSSVVYLPCRHCCACASCPLLSRCPICRGSADRHLRIFVS